MELYAGHWWASRELGEVGVALVSEVLDPDFAGEESVCGELAQEGEEFDRLTEAFVLFQTFAIGDEVEDFLLLLRRAIQIGLAIAGRAGGVEPFEAAC